MKLVPYDTEEEELEEGELPTVEEEALSVFPSIPVPTRAPIPLNETIEKSTLCQECSKQVFKYKCPRCLFLSCSLACCKAHKERLNCSGERSQTHFVPLTNFSEHQLMSDLKFLEKIEGRVDCAVRSVKRDIKRGKAKKKMKIE